MRDALNNRNIGPDLVLQISYVDSEFALRGQEPPVLEKALVMFMSA